VHQGIAGRQEFVHRSRGGRSRILQSVGTRTARLTGAGIKAGGGQHGRVRKALDPGRQMGARCCRDQDESGDRPEDVYHHAAGHRDRSRESPGYCGRGSFIPFVGPPGRLVVVEPVELAGQGLRKLVVDLTGAKFLVG